MATKAKHYVEVLLDVLQADDDNADLSDGTPNGAAILGRLWHARHHVV